MSNQQLSIVGGAQHGISFLNLEKFELAQRVGNMLANSELVPDAYKGKVANCVLALDIAERTGSNVLMVMQNLNMIHGKPSWSSQYIIAAIASCGRFTPLAYQINDLGPINVSGISLPKNLECIAYAWERSVPAEKRTNENRLESAPISFETAILEGWWSKKGSKWPTMRDLMLRYRAATLFGRMYAPDVLMGMQAQEEVHDIIDIDPLPERDEKKALALEGKMDAPTGTRRKRGAAAVDPIVPAEPDPSASTAGVSNQEPAPAPAPAEQAPAPAPVTAPAPAPAGTKVRTSVKSSAQVQTPDQKLITKVLLEGEEFTGEAYYEAPLIKFAPDGAVIDAMMERRAHKTKEGVFINVIASFEIVGG